MENSEFEASRIDTTEGCVILANIFQQMISSDFTFGICIAMSSWNIHDLNKKLYNASFRITQMLQGAYNRQICSPTTGHSFIRSTQKSKLQYN